MERIMLSFLAAVFIWACVNLLAGPIRTGVRFVSRAVLAGALLYFMDMISVHTGISLSFNVISLLVLSVLGIPGLIFLLLLG